MKSSSLKPCPKIVFALVVVTGLLSALAIDAPTEVGSNAASSSRTPRAEPLTARTFQTNEWKDTGKVLPEVIYDGLPITEVAEDLKKRFENEFDVLLPNGPGAWERDWNWANTLVSLRLKSVNASEIFNAMNLVFETSHTPLQWALLMNGRRPTALLRGVTEPKPLVINPQTGVLDLPQPDRPMVFFIGDLVGDPKSGGMTIDQLVATVGEVCRFGIGDCNISSHKEAQLLIVRGKNEQIQFVQETLSALREKNQLDRQRQAEARPADSKTKAKTNETLAR